MVVSVTINGASGSACGRTFAAPRAAPIKSITMTPPGAARGLARNKPVSPSSLLLPRCLRGQNRGDGKVDSARDQNEGLPDAEISKGKRLERMSSDSQEKRSPA